MAVLRRVRTSAPQPSPPAAPPAKAAAATAVQQAPPSDGGSAGALPAARKILSEAGIAPGELQGTGRGGRVTKGDAIGAVEARTEAAKAAPAPAAKAPPAPAVKLPADLGSRPEQRVPMSRLRQRVAERLVQSQSTAAILTTFNEVNMQPVMELRSRYKDRFEKAYGVKLGFMSFFVKASIAALKRFPVLNAAVDGNDIIYHEYYDIGVAVSTDRGLVVPIVRDADLMSIAEIEKQIADFGKRAQ